MYQSLRGDGLNLLPYLEAEESNGEFKCENNKNVLEASLTVYEAACFHPYFL